MDEGSYQKCFQEWIGRQKKSGQTSKIEYFEWHWSNY